MTKQGREKNAGTSLTGWNGMVERKIAQAYAEGLFENLEDAGKPLDLRQNPFQDPAWRLALHVLDNAGLAPAWVEERRSIQEALTRLRPAQQDPVAPAAEVRSETAREIETLSKRIERYNLTVPHPAFRLDTIRK